MKRTWKLYDYKYTNAYRLKKKIQLNIVSDEPPRFKRTF